MSLNELLCALQTKGAFNNGAVELKEIASYFEKVFSLDLRQYRRTFLEIRDRKSDRTKFLNTLAVGLTKRMEETDETF